MPCCNFPHGILSVYALTISISCWLMSFSSSWGCYFMNVDFTLDPANSEIYGRGDSRMGMGLFSFEDNDLPAYICRAYTGVQISSFLDGPVRAARAFGVLSNLCLGIPMLFFIFLSCVGTSTILIKAMGVLTFMGSIFTLLEFVAFASKLCDENECTFYFGAGVAIVCVVFALINTCIIFLIPESGHDVELDLYGEGAPKLRVVQRSLFTKEERGPNDPLPPPASKAVAPEDANPGEPVIKEKKMSDGSTVIIKTVRNPDGTRVVEETTIPKGSKAGAGAKTTTTTTTPASNARSLPMGGDEEIGVPVLTEKILPDGRKQFIKTIRNADGSKTVEETTIDKQ